MFNKLFSWIPNTYYWLLWYFGFADTDGNLHTPFDREKVTYMLRRMKERMGVVWWFISLGSMYGVWSLVLLVSWWWLLLVVFQLWLFVHVLLVYKSPDEKFWEGDQSANNGIDYGWKRST